MGKFFRTNLGPHFTEGARRLWLRMGELGWDQPRVSREIGAGGGTLHKLMYGDRKIGLPLANAIKEKLGIDTELWGKAPTEAFVPPAALVDEPAQQPSTGAAA